MIAQVLIASARAADELGIRYGSPAVQAGRALSALPDLKTAIQHAEMVVAHLKVLASEEAGEARERALELTRATIAKDLAGVPRATEPAPAPEPEESAAQ